MKKNKNIYKKLDFLLDEKIIQDNLKSVQQPIYTCINKECGFQTIQVPQYLSEYIDKMRNLSPRREIVFK